MSSKTKTRNAHTDVQVSAKKSTLQRKRTKYHAPEPLKRKAELDYLEKLKRAKEKRQLSNSLNVSVEYADDIGTSQSITSKVFGEG